MAKRRIQYMVVDTQRKHLIGSSPSLMGAKKMAALHGWRDENDQLRYGTIYKDTDVMVRGDHAEPVEGAVIVAERIVMYGKWSWSDKPRPDSLPYAERSDAARMQHRKDMNTYRSKFCKTSIMLPRDIDEAMRQAVTESRNAYIVGLIRDDLRERGYLVD